ncbi:ABC transporter substrate-binding protein [Trichocoleus sp. FACHB-6]|nr:ABC transporter substrate-binding protein [Trichocoleus sp. FACHB-832]MBD2065512.1 ABC transporter substrate-binding protein [Trichocoleus sp. FACHB-6]
MKSNIHGSRLPRFQYRLGFRQILGLVTTFLVAIALIFILLRKPVTLSFVVPNREAEQWQPLIEEFHSKNRDIRINLTNFSQTNPEKPENTDQVKELYTAAFQKKRGKLPYDLIYQDIAWVPTFAEAGWLRDISDWISKEELDKFLRSEVEAGRYQGKLYRIPFRTDVGVLYYRKDLLERVKENPPETFDDLIRISQNLQKQGIAWGYLWQGSRSEAITAMFYEVLHGYGGFWIDPKTRVVGLDRPEALKAVEFLHNTIMEGISPKGVTSYREDETRSLFTEGKAVFLRNWPDVWVQANAADSFIRGKIDIKPMVHAAGYSSGACKGGWGFGIAQTTKHPKQAWKAIQFFTSAAAQRHFVLTMSFVPSRRTLFIDPQIIDKYSHYPKLLEIIDEYSILRPPIPEYGQASDILQQYLWNALMGQQNPQAAMKAAAEQTRKLLANG